MNFIKISRVESNLIPFLRVHNFRLYNAISITFHTTFEVQLDPLYAIFAHLFVQEPTNVRKRSFFFPPLRQTIRKGTQHTVHTAKGTNFGLGWIHRARTIKKVCAKPCFPAGFRVTAVFPGE